LSDVFDPRTHVAAPAELAGRVIAVTGASAGIGRAVALACAQKLWKAEIAKRR